MTRSTLRVIGSVLRVIGSGLREIGSTLRTAGSMLRLKWSTLRADGSMVDLPPRAATMVRLAPHAAGSGADTRRLTCYCTTPLVRRMNAVSR